MHVIYLVILFILYFGILIHCQGRVGGGGGSSGGGGGGSGGGHVGGVGGVGVGGTGAGSNYQSSNTSCTTDSCERTGIIVGSVVGGIIALVILLVCLCCCCKRPGGQPLQDNITFITLANIKDNNKQEASDVNPFMTGIWSSYYLQYGKWHGPHRFPLSFDCQSMKVTGSGFDDVGAFIIDGIYSIQTRRIGLTQTYRAGTGNRSENLGHQVIIQLTWYSERHQFEGKWYVRTNRYHGEGEFELKTDGQQPPPPSYQKVCQ